MWRDLCLIHPSVLGGSQRLYSDCKHPKSCVRHFSLVAGKHAFSMRDYANSSYCRSCPWQEYVRLFVKSTTLSFVKGVKLCLYLYMLSSAFFIYKVYSPTWPHSNLASWPGFWWTTVSVFGAVNITDYSFVMQDILSRQRDLCWISPPPLFFTREITQR